MNKRIKKLWIKALRSGKYRQGLTWLRSDGKFCCLGVLCDLYRTTEHRGKWIEAPLGYRFKLGKEDVTSLPPSIVAKWAGLDNVDPHLGKTRLAKTASSLNDSGKDFNYIADRIEKYL